MVLEPISGSALGRRRVASAAGGPGVDRRVAGDAGLLEAPRMHPVTLRFAPVAWERAFFDAYYAASLTPLRIGFALAAVANGSYALLAATVAPAWGNWLLALPGAALPFAMLRLSYAPAFKTLMRPLMAVWLAPAPLLSGLNAIATRDQPGIPESTGVVILAFVLFTLHFSRLGFLAAAPLALAGAAAWAAAGLAAGLFEGSAFVFCLAAALAVALLAAYLAERHLRGEFVAARLLAAERAKSERLLLNVLPAPIAERLKAGESALADRYPEATVVFADLVGSTPMAAAAPPDRVVEALNGLFSAFDRAGAARGVEMTRTAGDGYMAVVGVPTPRPDHCAAAADLALAMLEAAGSCPAPDGTPLRVRVGINTGPLVAAVVGTTRFHYDVWGDAVNTASRMESHGVPGAIQVTEAVYERLEDRYAFERRGVVDVKGKGPMPVYLLRGRRAERAPAASAAATQH